tara:strand:+ start:1335 stop:1586 length:252 start_codon:yes stop_codon:yes gene_type:complete
MKIFIILTITLLAIFFIGKNIVRSAKRNLFKDQSAWSAKEIKIKYSNSREIKKSKGTDNFLEMIAEESEIYLDDQSNKDDLNE